jgi:hypothetical protein
VQSASNCYSDMPNVLADNLQQMLHCQSGSSVKSMQLLKPHITHQ